MTPLANDAIVPKKMTITCELETSGRGKRLRKFTYRFRTLPIDPKSDAHQCIREQDAIGSSRHELCGT